MGDPKDKIMTEREAENYKKQQALDAEKADIEAKAKKKGKTVGATQYLNSKAKMEVLAEQFEKNYTAGPIFSSINSALTINDCKTPLDKELFELKSDIQELCAAIKKYSNTLASFDIRKVKADIRKEQDTIKLVETRLYSINEKMSALMLNEISDTPHFQKMYQDFIDIDANMTSLTSGGLMENLNMYENGKEVHHLHAPNPDIKKYIKEQNEGYTRRGNKIKYEEQWTPIETNLFDHDPCPEDVMQGGLGDCFYMSALAAIAAQDPDRIRNMISHNPNNHTVTVKFYNNNFEPCYVTVDDTLPSYNYKIIDRGFVDSEVKSVDEKDPFSKGANWVKFFEKAFAASGLNLQGTDDLRANRIMAGLEQGSYADVDMGGATERMMAALLGPSAYKDKDNIVSAVSYEKITFDRSSLAKKAKKAEAQVTNRDPNIPKNFPSSYITEEVELFNKIKQAYDAGKPLSTSTPMDKDYGDQEYAKTKGLPSGHAYAIIGVEQDKKTGICYVSVRNPHATGIRVYDKDGNPKLKTIKGERDISQKGVSRVELRDFIRSFDDVKIAQFDKLPAEREAISKGNAMKSLYGEVITKLCTSIAKTDSYIGRITDSKQFAKLRKQAIATKTIFAKKNVTDEEIRNSMNDLFSNAEDYKTYRDNNPKEKDGDKKEKSIKRYISADILSELKKGFLINENAGLEKAKAIDMEKLKNVVLQLGDNASMAKKAAVESLKGTMEKEHAAYKAWEDKIRNEQAERKAAQEKTKNAGPNLG